MARALGPLPSKEPGHPAPGAVSRLLEELADAPPTALGDGWDSWLAPGVVTGRFELVREIGRGGFGVVWEAIDRESGHRVAFKAVRPGGKGGVREARLRFLHQRAVAGSGGDEIDLRTDERDGVPDPGRRITGQ